MPFLFKMDKIFLQIHAAVQNKIKQCNIITVALKEKSTPKHIKYAYIDIFMMRLVFLVLTCWVVLYFCYYCETLVVMCHAEITGGHC